MWRNLAWAWIVHWITPGLGNVALQHGVTWRTYIKYRLNMYTRTNFINFFKRQLTPSLQLKTFLPTDSPTYTVGYLLCYEYVT